MKPRSLIFPKASAINTLFIGWLSIFCLCCASGCRENKVGHIANHTGRSSTMDTAKIHAALRRQAQLPMGSPERESVLRAILAESIAIGYNDKVCYLMMDFATHYAERGNMDSTREYYAQAQQYCFSPVFDRTLPASWLIESGAYYHSMRSDYISAYNNYYQALRYLRAQKLTENELSINLYIYLISIQEHLGRHKQALAYLIEGERLALKLHSMQALIAIRTSFGDYYFEQKDFQRARQYYDLALENEQAVWNPDWDPNILIAALVGKASVRTATGEAVAAIPFLKRAIRIAQDNNIGYSASAASVELGVAYNSLGQFSETIQLVSPSVHGSNHEISWKKEDAYRVLMVAYEGLGNFEEALVWQRKLHALSDSLMNAKTAASLQELELKYQTVNKDREIAAKQLLIEQQRNKIDRKNIMIAGISGVAILVMLILTMLYKAAAQKHRLQALKLDTLHRQHELKLLRSTIQGEDQERKRLSRELHDGIGSMLFSIIMRVSMLKKKDPGAVQSKDYEELLQMLEQTGNEVRKTAQNMMPDIINRQSLSEAVQAFCETISQNSSLNIEVQFYGDTHHLPDTMKLVVYRIIQELVHNVLKHAKASQAIVQGVLNKDHFSVTVEDNGTGFDATKTHPGLGLKNLASRIKSLNGTLQIESEQGKGTTVYMEFELRNFEYGEPAFSREA